MKKLNFLLISAFVCVFLFVSCGQELDTEKSDSVTPFELLESNDNDQGEDEGNGKKPQIEKPLIEENEGVFIFTDIPSEFNGKHAFFVAFSGCFVSYSYYGFNSITNDPPNYYLNMGQINNGIVKLPVWDFNFHWIEGSLSAINNFRYLGNDTFKFMGVTGSSDAIIAIYDFSSFPVPSNTTVSIPAEAPLAMITFPVTFSNGNAVISFLDGELMRP